MVRVAGYRFRVTYRRRRGAYLALIMLVGLLGGIALGSIAAGRRTQSSFPAFVASVNLPAPAAARLLGWHVGDVVPMGVYTNDQTMLPDFGQASVAPHERVDLKLVGIVVSPESVVADDVDAGVSTYLQIFTPALTRPLL